jgi:hypothetical protein
MAAMDPLMDGGERNLTREASELNAAEAKNLAFLVSHRLERHGISLFNPPEADETAILQLATDVGIRMRDLSLNLASEDTRARITSVSFA